MPKPPRQPHYIGIDFGTSKCVTTWINPKDGDAEVRNNGDDQRETPSVVYFPAGREPRIGLAATDILENEAIVDQESPRIVFSAKRHIARRLRYMFDPYPTPRDVATIIFKKLRSDLERLWLQFPPTHAVVTVPATYDLIQRECIRQAALAAGFEVIVLLDEPTAAAIAYYKEAHFPQASHTYGEMLPKLGDVFMVYDLGAGTFDLSVLKKADNPASARRYEPVLKPGGLAFGGDDIDLALYRYLDGITRETFGRSFSGTEQVSHKLLNKCRQIKQKICRDNSDEAVNLRLHGSTSDYLSHTVTARTFDGLIRPLIEKTLDPVQRLLDRVVKEEIGTRRDGFPLDNIILIGGSSRIPMIKDLLRERFGVQVLNWGNQNVAVALGAAYLAHDLFRPQSTATVSLPPVRAARLEVAVPPLKPEVGDAVILRSGGAEVARGTLREGLHVAFNVPPGKADLRVQAGGRPEQAVPVVAALNRRYRLKLVYDPATGRFDAREIAEDPAPLARDGVTDDEPEAEPGRPDPLAEFADAPDVCAELYGVLTGLAASLREFGLKGEEAARFEEMANGIYEPCVVAVVGRVKAGKSTFVNALLGEDLAKVGAVETTATINRFAHGNANPDRPVLCRRRDGSGELVTKQFLDGLQGNSEEVLAMARDIEYLEYRLPLPFLERVILVDTPGMGAAVQEHNQRVQEYLGIGAASKEAAGDSDSFSTEERKRASETYDRSREAGSRADAVIFVIGQVPRATDEGFLQAFAEVLYPGTRALNAVGVMAKVDELPGVFARRRELCRKIQDQLLDKLNIVLPVSAALQRFLDTTDDAHLLYIAQTVRKLGVATDAKGEVDVGSDFGYLLGMDTRWKTEDEPEEPYAVPPAERAALCEGMPWGTFVTVAKTLRLHESDDPAVLRAALEEVAGFEPLRHVLNQRFVRRGDMIRAYRVTQNALDWLERTLRHGLPELRKRVTDEQGRFADWLEMLGKIKAADGARVAGLADFLREQRDAKANVLPRALADLNRCLRHLTWLYHTLQDDYADMDALELLEVERLEQPDSFSPDEQKEVREVLGSYGRKLADRLGTRTRPVPSEVGARMAYWARVAHDGMGTRRRQEIAHAVTQRYGILLDELLRLQPARG
jgi:molecular chaperone DnaK (HSP70)